MNFVLKLAISADTAMWIYNTKPIFNWSRQYPGYSQIKRISKSRLLAAIAVMYTGHSCNLAVLLFWEYFQEFFVVYPLVFFRAYTENKFRNLLCICVEFDVADGVHYLGSRQVPAVITVYGLKRLSHGHCPEKHKGNSIRMTSLSKSSDIYHRQSHPFNASV